VVITKQFILQEASFLLASGHLTLPGPSSTERGFPVLSTGSPTVTPAINVTCQGIKFSLLPGMHL